MPSILLFEAVRQHATQEDPKLKTAWTKLVLRLTLVLPLKLKLASTAADANSLVPAPREAVGEIKANITSGQATRLGETSDGAGGAR